MLISMQITCAFTQIDIQIVPKVSPQSVAHSCGPSQLSELAASLPGKIPWRFASAPLDSLSDACLLRTGQLLSILHVSTRKMTRAAVAAAAAVDLSQPHRWISKHGCKLLRSSGEKVDGGKQGPGLASP